jgi:hypothetical protein
MKQIVTKEMFTEVMTCRGFSYNGARALYEYLEEIDEYSDEYFDPIAYSIAWTEYSDLSIVAHEYGEEYGDLDYLSQETMTIEFEGGIIVLNF